MTDSHEAQLENVALYALGMLPAENAATCTRAHIDTCAQCRAEYEALAFAPEVLARTLPQSAPSDLLKARIMREVRASKRGVSVLPAYLAAAACLVIAVVTAFAALHSQHQLRDAQTQLAQAATHNATLEHQLNDERLQVADLLGNSRKYPVAHGAVVRSHDRIYLALHDLPRPQAGHTYQAWTLPRGHKDMSPSVTFTPDANGDAIVRVPADADLTVAVAVSVEPDGGSKAPTTKPILVTTLD